MASVISERHNGRTRYRIQYRDGDKRRKSIRLGGVNKRAASAVASKIEALNACCIAGQALPTDLAKWVSGLGDDLRSKLADAGLAEPRRSITLGTFLDEYIDGRKADSSQSTINNFRQLQQKLLGYFGDCDVRSIDEGQCDDWRQSLARDYADATISKHVKRARQVFKAAIRKRVCDSNPFAEVKGGSEQNDSRKYFVEQAVIDALAPDYLKRPRVSVEVLNYRPFYILGEIGSPGSYAFVNGMQVINAIALAGGYTYRARENKVFIIRATNDEREEEPADHNTFVLPGDVILVPERYF